MNARCLLLPAILVVGFAASWSPVRGDLPQAPPPREKKTVGEKLIGSWKAVVRNGREVPKDWAIVFHFVDSGQLHIFIDDQKHPPNLALCTYRLERKTVHIYRPEQVGSSEMAWNFDIEFVSDDELVFLATPTDKERIELQRQQTK